MTMDLHQGLLHDTLALSTPFLLAVIATAVATTAVGLICSGRARLSAASRHLLLSIALLAPPAGALLLSTGVVDLLRAATAALPVETVTSLGDVAAVASVAGGASEVPCILFSVWLAGIVAFLAFSSVQWMRWARLARRAMPVGDLTPGTVGILTCRRRTDGRRRVPARRSSTGAIHGQPR
jgi:xanthine/uracil permease